MNIERMRSKKELYEHMRSLIELLCKDRESRMYFVSMSGECDVWVGERGEVWWREGKRFEGVITLSESSDR